MIRINQLFLAGLVGLLSVQCQDVSAQCRPYILIDGNAVSPDNLALPYWLSAEQTLGKNNAVSGISVIEFEVDGNSLLFKQVRSITSTTTVPDNHVWKIESIARLPVDGTVQNSVTYSTPGTYTFTVPSCTNYICIEAWGGGGGGGGTGTSTASVGGGGGGGGYGAGCYVVTPGGPLTVTVGAGGTGAVGTGTGGTGGSSSVGSLITSTGGSPGGSNNSGTSGAGGLGGSSNALAFIVGSTGNTGSPGNCGTGGRGGDGANGGAGGNGGSCNNGQTGNAPGGGGGGGNSGGSTRNGGAGGAGRVRISW